MPKHWKTYKLEDAIEKLIDYRGKTPKKTTHGVPLVTAKVIKGGRILEPNEFISQEDYEPWMRRGIPEIGDVVLTTEAPLGEVAQIKNADIALAQRVITLRGKIGVLHSGYLKYFLQSNIGQSRLEARQSGTTVFGIKQSELRKVEIDCPLYPEQKAIASILSALDDKIENNLAMNRTLEDMAMALYKHWFVDFGPFQDGKFVESELGLIPEDWEVKELGDLLHLKHGYAFKGKFFTKDERKELLLSPGNFERDGGIKFNWGKQKFYEGEIPDEYVLEKGDLLIALTDLTQSCDILGAPAFIPDEDFKYLHNQRLGLVQVSNENVSKDFLFCLANSSAFREYIKSTKTGSTVSHTSPSRVYKFKAVIPPSELVIEVYDSLKRFNKTRFSNLAENKCLTTLRNTLLPKLISGEVRLKEFENQIAAAL